MKKTLIILVVILGILIIGGIIFFNLTPIGINIINTWEHSLQKADDNTNYETLKKVEDTCRAMISSYNADKLTYEQYKDSENEEQRGWADQAKMRANKTASTYNIYILQNSYLWKNNIPNDIYMTLSYLN